MQIEALNKRGYFNLYIIDNNSTYKPLLSYYKTNKISVFYLGENIGFLSIWKTLVYEYFKDSYYVYTDSDLIPSSQCPDDFMDHFRKLLVKYPEIDKVGFGLEIDDLPAHYSLRTQVQEHERQFWQDEVEKDVYDAMIDTTFALYRPKKRGGYWLKSLRTGGNYKALHLPWYSDPGKLSEEDKYYNINVKTSTHWTDLLNGKNEN
ncbi:MAG: glycosyltransferase family 2 protein [Bacteroidota bacterium]|nr:glycosyltransferase family 2 protein [Bacteroidota bacterium]